MEKKVLIAYGTRYGSAGIAAGEIAEFLKARVSDVELVNLRSERPNRRLNEYDLVIAGSSVAMFSWVAAVKSFLRRAKKAGVPTAVFITCGTAIEEPDKARERFLDKVVNRIGIHPVLSDVVAPIIDFRPELGLPTGLKSRIKGTIGAIAKDRFDENGLMDFRDQKRFKSFLDRIAGQIS